MRTEAQKAARKRYYAEHRDEINRRRRAAMAKRRDAINARKRAYDAAHRERVRAQKRAANKRYRDSHKELLKVKHNLYRRGVGRQKEFEARLRTRYDRRWRDVCDGGEESIRNYLGRATAKIRVAFAEWFGRMRREIGWPHMRLRGQFGVYTLVHDFGI